MNVDKSEARIRRMFGQVSLHYDFLNHMLSAGTDLYWRWRTVQLVPPNGEAPILDVCTGTGDLAIAYWKKSSGRVPVVGTDFTHEMLELANRKAAKHNGGVTSLTFLEADTQRLPFAHNQFQIVSAAFGLRNVTNTTLGLQEMTRVCQPGGRVVVLEFSMPNNPILGLLYRWYFRNILPRIGQFVSCNQESAYNYLPQSVSEFSQGEVLSETMRECGLSDIWHKSLTFGVAVIYCGVKLTVKQ